MFVCVDVRQSALMLCVIINSGSVLTERTFRKPNLTFDILTYNELDHSLPSSLPACRYQLIFKYYYHCGLEKRWGRLFGQTFFERAVKVCNNHSL
jgi:hypothetical protein